MRSALVARRGADRAAALTLLREAYALVPEHAGLAGEFASELVQHRLWGEAEPILRTLAAQNPGDIAVTFRLARCLKMLGRLDDALVLFEAILARSPAHVPSRLQVAGLRLGAGDIDAAEPLYTSVYNDDPASFDAVKGLAHCANRRGDPATAAHHLVSALALRPDNPQILLGLATALRQAGDSESALRCYEQGIRSAPESAAFRLGAARLLAHRGNHAEALDCLERAPAPLPMTAEYQREIAKVAKAAGRLDRAGAAWRALLASDPGDRASLRELVADARRRGDVDELRQFLPRLAAIEPIDDRAAIQLATLQFEAGDLASAQATLLGLAPTVAAAGTIERRIADRLEDLGQAEEAETFWARLRARTPRDREAWLRPARAGMARGDFGRVRSLLAAALIEFPADRDLLALSIEALIQGLDFDGAIAEIDRQIAAAPDNLATLEAALRTCLRLSRRDHGCAILEAALARRPDEARLHQIAMPFLRDAGRYDLAERIGRRSVTRDPDNPQALLELAEVMICAGRLDDAAEQFETLFASEPKFRFWQEWFNGRIAELRGDASRARAHFAVCLIHFFNDALVFERMAQIRLRQFDVDEARALWRKALASRLGRDEQDSGDIKHRRGLLGHILNDFALDKPEIERFRAKARHEPTRRDTASPQVPFTPERPRLWFALEVLRRAGVFSHNQAPFATPAAGASVIPKRIFFCHPDRPTTPELAARAAAWRRFNPGYEVIEVSPETADRLIANRYDAGIAAAFAQVDDAALRRDLVKLMLVFAIGGFAVDQSLSCLTPLDPHVPSGAEIVVAETYFRAAGNTLLGAVPRHPAIRAALGIGIKASVAQASCNSWIETGPGAVSMAVAGWLLEGTTISQARLSRLHHLSQLRLAMIAHAADGWLRRA